MENQFTRADVFKQLNRVDERIAALATLISGKMTQQITAPTHYV